MWLLPVLNSCPKIGWGSSGFLTNRYFALAERVRDKRCPCSIRPLCSRCLLYVFFSAVCASYSKHIIHIKLPNDFLLNAFVCERRTREKKPNKKNLRFSYVIRDDFWLRWDGICENDGFAEFTLQLPTHASRRIESHKGPNNRKKSKPITLRRTNSQTETKET